MPGDNITESMLINSATNKKYRMGKEPKNFLQKITHMSLHNKNLTHIVILFWVYLAID